MIESLRRAKFEYIFCILITVLMIVSLSCVFLVRDREAFRSVAFADLSEGWTYEDGSEVILSDLEAKTSVFTIRRRITEEERKQGALCFYTKNIYLEIFCDGESVYSFSPKVPAIFGKAYGTYMHHTEIPLFSETADLQIVITPIYPDSSNFIRNMLFTDAGSFVRDQVSRESLRFLMCFVMMALGVILFAQGLKDRNLGGRRTEILAIGAFSFVAAMYIMSQLQIPSLITGNPSILHFVDYMSLICLGFPAVAFSAGATGNGKSPLVRVIACFSIANMVIQMLFTGLGISDYHQLLRITHFHIILSTAISLIFIGMGLKRATINIRLYRLLIVSFGFVGITGAYDIFSYTFSSNQMTGGGMFQYGMILFVFLMGYYEVMVIIDIARTAGKAEMMEKLAFHDGLTGLFNRQAFFREVKKLKEETSGVYSFVMFDVNNLKTMNDEYGHEFGDALIKAAADVITESFGKNGLIFRMGGDEFFAIFKASEKDETFKQAAADFEEGIRSYNESSKLPLPLAIAYGSSDYHCGNDDPEAVEQDADQKMYDMKIRMKGSAR